MLAAILCTINHGGGTSKKKKTKLIRFSDLDARERIEALKTIPVKPFISQDVIIIEDDDDEILLMALTRILH